MDMTYLAMAVYEAVKRELEKQKEEEKEAS